LGHRSRHEADKTDVKSIREVSEWTGEFSVNVKLFDLQHARFLRHIARLEAAMCQGKASPELSEILADLADYAQEHFATEEAVMKAYAFPWRDHHALEHRQASASLDSLRIRCACGEPALSVEVLDRLRGWLERHVLEWDRKYAEHLNACGLF
jgi:hemerythrin